MIVRWQNDHHYHLVHVHQDMFGDWIVTRAWGQIGTQFGGIKHTLVSSYEEAMTLLDDIGHIHESRGFRRVSCSHAEAERQLAELQHHAHAPSAP